MLLNALDIRWSPEGRLRAVLRERAVDAFDDMLWSRFQLFQQVYNHKTNVLLNAMLHQAVQEILYDEQLHLKRPRSLRGYLSFTDDLVMSTVFTHCVGGHGEDTTYGKARSAAVCIDRCHPRPRPPTGCRWDARGGRTCMNTMADAGGAARKGCRIHPFCAIV